MSTWREKILGAKKKWEEEVAQEAPTTTDEFLSAEKLDAEAEPDKDADRAMGIALEMLRSQHLSFRRPEKSEVSDLEELRLAILTAVTESPALEDYYYEAWGSGPPATVAGGSVASTSPSAYRRIAVMQLELMTRAFYQLQLQLFANAPENHGWMTLFRNWGRSSRFHKIFLELRPTLTPQFVRFYDLYLDDLPARTGKHGCLPIHHPWHEAETELDPAAKEKRKKGRGLFMDSGRAEGDVEFLNRPGAGGVVDQRGSEGADQKFETPSDKSSDSETGGGEPAPNA